MHSNSLTQSGSLSVTASTLQPSSIYKLRSQRHRKAMIDRFLRESDGDIPSYSTIVDDYWDVKRAAFSKMRSIQWKHKGHHRSKLSSSHRIQETQRRQRASHNQLVLANRGIYISGLANDRQNLGNLLHISEAYIRDLDMDKDQCAPFLKLMDAGLLDGVVDRNSSSQLLYVNGDIRSTSIVTIVGPPDPLEPVVVFVLAQAAEMVHQTFSDIHISMDLVEGCYERDFSVAVLVDNQSMDVMAAVQYVFMRKYIWIECLAVKKQYQGACLGKVLMER